MTGYGGKGSDSEDAGSNRTKTIAAVSAIVVAMIGLLSSPVWGPSICQAVGVCERTEQTPVSESLPGPTTGAPPATTGQPTQSPTFQSPSKRSRGTGYPSYAGDYCEEFVRAWQDGYADRAQELSNPKVVALVFAITPPTHYRNEWGPGGQGAICNILDTDRGNALAVRLLVKGQTTQPGAITEATV